MLKRRLVTAGAAVVLSLSMLGGAMATPPGLDEDANDTNAAQSNNCIAFLTAPHRHNGQHTTLGYGGDPSGKNGGESRGEEIKRLQASCGAQAEE